MVAEAAVVQIRVKWFPQQTYATVYELGIGGNKPARLFTASERGPVWFKYCRRKIVWDTVEALVQRGLTSDVAIDRIYSECGGVNEMVNDAISRLKHFRVIGNAALHMYRRQSVIFS